MLALLGYPFDIMAADVDEATVDHPDPAQNAVLTAQLKARAIIEHLPDQGADRVILLTADTAVALDGQMLGKPADTAEAKRMLKALRGRQHQVHTGMVLVDLDSGEEATAVHTAQVTMRRYTDGEIERYISSGDPMDKAGAYAIQHPRFRPVESLNGCYLGVMGLSICQLRELMQHLDLPAKMDADMLVKAHGHHPCPLL